LSESELAQARRDFEPAWNRLNLFRTAVSLVIATLLIVVLSLK